MDQNLGIYKDVIGALAVAITAILFISLLVRLLRTMMLHRTIREAIIRDSPITPELLDKIEGRTPAAGGDDRIGLVLIALGAAQICFALIQEHAGATRDLIGIALFPLFVGGVLVGRFWYLGHRGVDH